MHCLQMENRHPQMAFHHMSNNFQEIPKAGCIKFDVIKIPTCKAAHRIWYQRLLQWSCDNDCFLCRSWIARISSSKKYKIEVRKCWKKAFFCLWWKFRLQEHKSEIHTYLLLIKSYIQSFMIIYSSQITTVLFNVMTNGKIRSKWTTCSQHYMHNKLKIKE